MLRPSPFLPAAPNTTKLIVSLTAFVYFLLLSPSSALKHSFTANHDGRFFIGPIGQPFGFLKGGIYSLRVSKFRINIVSHGRASKQNDKNNPMTDKDIIDTMDGLHPGFLLKRFDSESDFATFRERILENALTCGFGGIEDEIDEGSFMDNDDHGLNSSSSNATQITDDMVATGRGVFDAGTDGIFLSMKHPLQWKPNEPTVHHTFTAQEAGYYFLFYQVCLLEGAPNEKYLFKEVQSTFRLEFEYKNYDVMGKVSYLTAGEMPLPHLYLYFSISYSLMLFLWMKFIRGDESQSSRRPTIYAIHHLMSSVVLLKALSMLFESARYHFIRIHGHAELWSFIYYILNFIKGTFLFTVILLLGSGWSFFKPFLTAKERMVIYVVFLLQVIDNIMILVLTHETMGERYYNDWSAILHLVDIVSCCATLIPIVWQVNALERSIEEASGEHENVHVHGDSNEGIQGESETKRLQSKLSLFRSFYIIVVAYIYFTRIVVYLFASTLSYNQTWIRYFITEVGTLLFYMIVGIKFKPTLEDEYVQVNNDDEQVELRVAKEKESVIELGGMSHNDR